MIRVAILTTDNREHWRKYDGQDPLFGPAIEAALTGLAKISELEVHVVTCTQRAMRSPEKLAENMWFHSLLVPKIGWLRTGYQGCIRAVRRRLRELQPDIVHGQGTERECALAAIFSGFPNVVTIHGNMSEVAKAMGAPIGRYYWLASLLERFALPRTLGVFCNSAYTESVVAPRARRTWRVPNAVRQEFFAPLPPLPQIPAVPKLLNIGVISPYKRQVELLDLAEGLHRAGHRFEMQFIGAADPKTTYAAEFRNRVQAAEKAGFARYLGTQPLPELMVSLDTASALIHTPAEEAFGLVVAEALARNLKIFGAKVGGVIDIGAGVEGVELFPLDASVELGTAIGKWIQSDCPRPTSAATEMKARYHPEVIARRHAEIYQEICGGEIKRMDVSAD